MLKIALKNEKLFQVWMVTATAFYSFMPILEFFFFNPSNNAARDIVFNIDFLELLVIYAVFFVMGIITSIVCVPIFLLWHKLISILAVNGPGRLAWLSGALSAIILMALFFYILKWNLVVNLGLVKVCLFFISFGAISGQISKKYLETIGDPPAS